MVRVMIFIDHLNFEINLSEYYQSLNLPIPKLDYNKFPKELAAKIDESRLVRTYVFVAKPDDFLMKDSYLKSHWDWINGTLKNIRYMKVIEGEYVSRPIKDRKDMNINDKTTYYKEEKGTDVNMATYMLSRAFTNAYDYAILLSGDTDYIPVIKQVSDFGKNIIVTGIKNQNLTKQKPYSDDIFILDKDFFNKCLYIPEKTSV